MKHDALLTADELNEIRSAGKLCGLDLLDFAGSCPFSPRNSQRHRAWMDGFSEGRIAARSAFAPALPTP